MSLHTTHQEKMKEFEENICWPESSLFSALELWYEDEPHFIKEVIEEIKSHITSTEIAILEGVIAKIETMKEKEPADAGIGPVEAAIYAHTRGLNNALSNLSSFLKASITHIKEGKNE